MDFLEKIVYVDNEIFYEYLIVWYKFVFILVYFGCLWWELLVDVIDFGFGVFILFFVE